MSEPTIRIICEEPAVAERLINELYARYHPLTINISAIEGKPLITAVMMDRRELPRQAPMVAMPLPGGFKQ
jgi:hypothetical protein